MSQQNSNSQPCSTEKIREVAHVITGIDLQLALEEVNQLKCSLALTLTFLHDQIQAQNREVREFMDELWATLRKIQAQFRIDATLLGLIEPEKARSQGPPDDEEEDLKKKLSDWH